MRIVTPQTNEQPIDERWRSRYSAIVEALLELCTLTPEVHAYLSKRAIADQAEAAGVRGLPSGSDELRVLEQLLTKFSREELTRAQIVADDGSLALRDYPAFLPWRDALSGALVLQRRAVDQRERKYLWARGLSPRRPHRFGATSNRIAAVEGWFDGIAMHALYPEIEVLAFPSASTVKEEWSSLFADKDVLLAFDPDRAGTDAVEKFVKLFGPSVRSLERMRPAFGNDWNECLVHMSGGRHVR
jgi:DNA primase